MAYTNSTSDRMDELRFRRNDSSLVGLVSPPRNGTRLPQPLQSQDGRGGLMRRFTTDSGRVPTIASLATQRGTQEPQDYGPSVCFLFWYTKTSAFVLDGNWLSTIAFSVTRKFLAEDILLTLD